MSEPCSESAVRALAQAVIDRVLGVYREDYIERCARDEPQSLLGLTKQLEAALRTNNEDGIEELLADLRRLESLYNRDRIAQPHAKQIEDIFDKWLSPARPAAPEPAAWRNPEAARSSAQFALRFAVRQRHTEAVADCPHCSLSFLAKWVLDVLGPEPERPIPPGPRDPPRRKETLSVTPHPDPAEAPEPELTAKRIATVILQRCCADPHVWLTHGLPSEDKMERIGEIIIEELRRAVSPPAPEE